MKNFNMPEVNVREIVTDYIMDNITSGQDNVEE